MVDTVIDRSNVSAAEPPIVSLEGPRRRRVSLIILGGLVVVVAALVAAWLVASAGAMHKVLVAGADLRPGHVVAASDVRVVELGLSDSIATIDANGQELAVGKAARVPIPAGTLLNEAMFTDPDAALPPGSVLVGAVLNSGQLPTPTLEPGTSVSLISTQGADDGTVAVALGEGVVFGVEQADGGQHWVTLRVETDLQLPVATAAAGGHLSLGVVAS